MKTLTKALTDIGVVRRNRPDLGHNSPVRLSCGRHQGGRRCRFALLMLICGMLLAGCAMPEAIPTQSDQGSQSDQGAKVEAIQTRVAEERAGQASEKEDAMAGASGGAQGQTATAEESGGALVSGPTAEQLELLAKLRPQGEAPELLNEVWLNSEPLKLADLRGNVVLVEFWTYG
ncbi:MAG: hypothetical protein F4X14_12600 [Caldilineaceae bacterium SB0661_bin_32]|uniref:Redoxin domain-containing protein n=1 Tax=Caldilineaceae bacterium SB0661_bin_32 TaxID=2605255 RepID=A0A6B1D872_9CHLR|nr:hypothetical protein [Caldilineaceae bacterium SB0661_bin_32]